MKKYEKSCRALSSTVVLLSLALVGCASGPRYTMSWAHPSKTSSGFQQDISYCNAVAYQQAGRAPVYNPNACQQRTANGAVVMNPAGAFQCGYSQANAAGQHRQAKNAFKNNCMQQRGWRLERRLKQ